MDNKHLGLRIDEKTHYKLKFIADYEGRSINKQIIHLIHKCIREFEKENGIIEMTDNE